MNPYFVFQANIVNGELVQANENKVEVMVIVKNHENHNLIEPVFSVPVYLHHVYHGPNRVFSQIESEANAWAVAQRVRKELMKK